MADANRWLWKQLSQTKDRCCHSELFRSIGGIRSRGMGAISELRQPVLSESVTCEGQSLSNEDIE